MTAELEALSRDIAALRRRLREPVRPARRPHTAPHEGERVALTGRWAIVITVSGLTRLLTRDAE